MRNARADEFVKRVVTERPHPEQGVDGHKGDEAISCLVYTGGQHLVAVLPDHDIVIQDQDLVQAGLEETRDAQVPAGGQR